MCTNSVLSQCYNSSRCLQLYVSHVKSCFSYLGPKSAFGMTLFLSGVRVTQARVRVRVDSARGETKASIFERVLNVCCLFVHKKYIFFLMIVLMIFLKFVSCTHVNFGFSSMLLLTQF
jgi:hypothetical protein